MREPIRSWWLVNRIRTSWACRMAENPGIRSGLKVGDNVKVHAEATSVFTIVSIDGDDALIESIDSTPGAYAFHCKLEGLVPVES